VPDISRDGISHMIKSILLLAAQQRPADKGVAQIMGFLVVDARHAQPSLTVDAKHRRCGEPFSGNRPATEGEEKRFEARLPRYCGAGFRVS